MSFIENTYIDTVNNPESNSYEGLYGIAGVILGFGLTFVYDLYKNKKEINKVGKSFESIIIDTREKCYFQITHIEGFQKQYVTDKNAVLGISFLIDQNPISFIDKFKLFDYYYGLRNDKSRKEFFNTDGKVTEEIIHKYINCAFNDISILYIYVKSLNDVMENLTKDVTNYHNEYVKLFNDFAKDVTEYKNHLGGGFVNDEYAVHLDKLVTSHSVDMDDITTVSDSLHKDILFNTSYVRHPLYKIAFDFDANGIQRIQNTITTYENINRFLESKKKEIKEIYKIIYKKDLITKAV